MLVPLVVAFGLIVVGLLLDWLGDFRIVIPRFFEPYRLVNVVLLLRRPRRYATVLGSIAALRNLDDPHDRVEAVQQICRLVERPDIVDGFYDIGKESWVPKRLWRQALKLYREQSALAGVDLGSQSPGAATAADADEEDGGFLLLSISAGIQNPADFPSMPDLKDELFALIQGLPAGGVGDRSSLAYWYTPVAGEALTEDDGRERLAAVLASTI